MAKLLNISFFLIAAVAMPIYSGTLSLESHAIYISVVEIEHKNENEESIISIKVFTDDLENALRNKFKKIYKLAGTNNCQDYEGEVEAYFREHFKLRINDAAVDISLESCAENGDSFWIEFTAITSVNWKDVNVSADYFMELFPTQSNVISISQGEEKFFMRLTKSKKQDLVTFSD